MYVNTMALIVVKLPDFYYRLSETHKVISKLLVKMCLIFIYMSHEIIA